MQGSISVSVGDAKQPPAYRGKEAARNDAYRLYFQDTWQVNPKFNFSYGVAWSFDDNIICHDLDKPEWLRPVLGGPDADLRPTRYDYNNFQPSIGFAWTLDKQNKTVIRGGSGVYHASPNSFYTRLGERGFLGPAGNGLVPFNSQLVPNPFAGTPIPGTTANQPLTLNFTQPTTFNGQEAINQIPSIRNQLLSRWGTGQDISIRGVEVTKQALGAAGEGIFMSDLTTGYTFHVTAGVQRELARNMILTADFVMRRAVKFGGTEAGFGVDLNRAARPRVIATNPVTQVVTFAMNPVIPFCASITQLNTPKFPCSSGAILGYWSGINTRYIGLLMKLDKRFSGGWQFTGAYAFSRYTNNVNVGVGGVTTDNLYETAGISGNDIPHRFTFSGFYEIPEYKGDNRLLRGLFNSWQVGLISDMRSRPTLNPTLGLDIDGDGSSRYLLPGIPWNSFGRGKDADDIREAVAQHNADVISRAKPVPANATSAQIAQCTLFVNGQRMCGARTPQNQVIPLIYLPENFSNGDPFFSQDIRLTRLIRIGEKIRLSLIAEAFNVFNIANLSGYGSGLNALAAPGQLQQATFGQPSNRVNQIFGTGGPRALQFAARLSF